MTDERVPCPTCGVVPFRHHVLCTPREPGEWMCARYGCWLREGMRFPPGTKVREIRECSGTGFQIGLADPFGDGGYEPIPEGTEIVPTCLCPPMRYQGPG